MVTLILSTILSSSGNEKFYELLQFNLSLWKSHLGKNCTHYMGLPVCLWLKAISLVVKVTIKNIHADTYAIKIIMSLPCTVFLFTRAWYKNNYLPGFGLNSDEHYIAMTTFLFDFQSLNNFKCTSIQ